MGEHPKDYKVFVGEGLGTLRAEMIDGRAWFYAVDICKILDLPKMCRLVSNGTIKEGDYVLTERLSKSGRRKIYLINVKGVNALLNTKRAWKDVDKLVAFSSWFGEEIIDALHKVNADTESIKLKVGDKVVKEFPKKEEKVTATIPDQAKDMRTVENVPTVGEQVLENGNFKIFGSAEFDNVRATLINDVPWFVGKDVADILGYERADNAIRVHVDEEDKLMHQISASDQKRNMIIINESGLYSLILSSKLPSAKRFKRWVISEVLPAIRQTGSYQQTPPKPLTQLEMMRLQLGMIDNHEDRIKNLEDTMTIDYGQQESLANTVNRSVIDALGGKQSNAYKEIAKKVFAECNHDLKTYFNVNARNNVPRKRYDEAIEYAKNWKPCTNTLMLIRGCNAQMSF